MKDYKRDLQLKILEIIKDVDKICRENDIEYYLAYGSCLGAVRHRGFIPWDDDLDITLKYEEYEKFIKICEEKLDKSKYFVQTMKTDPNYYLSFAKIRNINTTLIEEANKNIDIVNGVYVDIFPLVGYPNNKLQQKIFNINRAFTLSANINVINNKLLHCIFKVVLKIFGKKRIIKFCTEQCVKYPCSSCQQLISVFDGDGVQVNLTSNEILGEPKYVKFEDTMLPIPQDYDTYLRTVYGDYMKIPSQEQIEEKTHTPYILDLEHSYNGHLKIKT